MKKRPELSCLLQEKVLFNSFFACILWRAKNRPCRISLANERSSDTLMHYRSCHAVKISKSAANLPAGEEKEEVRAISDFFQRPNLTRKLPHRWHFSDFVKWCEIIIVFYSRVKSCK